MSSAALFIHVPVDRVEIVSARVTGSKLFYFMGLNDPEKRLSIKVTLRTDSSEELFERKLVMMNIPKAWAGGFSSKLSHYPFTGMFAGQPITGQLVVSKRDKVTGEFRLT